jgi:hypothetical protein
LEDVWLMPDYGWWSWPEVSDTERDLPLLVLHLLNSH